MSPQNLLAQWLIRPVSTRCPLPPSVRREQVWTPSAPAWIPPMRRLRFPPVLLRAMVQR
ncbi:hypothetical protein [Nocardia nova]|uniref:hypothetical protein n=1 Tax=Nocardia nova TaxID=37330 RepID=UPI0033F11313